MASQIGERRRRIQRLRERAIETVLFLCAASSVLVTLGIVGVLVIEFLGVLLARAAFDLSDRYDVDAAVL